MPPNQSHLKRASRDSRIAVADSRRRRIFFRNCEHARPVERNDARRGIVLRKLDSVQPVPRSNVQDL